MDGIAINSFNKGLSQDFAKTLQQKDSYFEALNFRIQTESGQSTGILSNVKGTDLAVNIPNVGNLLFIHGTGRSNFHVTGIFSIIANSTTINFSYNPSYTIDDVNGWIELAALINNDVTIQSLGIIAFQSGLSIKLYSTLYYTITFVNISGDFTIDTLVDAQTDLVPIGSTNIRDEIFILTTSSLNVLPSTSSSTGVPGGGLSSNAGQIWKLTYDASLIDREPLSGNTFTLILLYNNLLNFSLTHPVSPTAIKGNYENDTTKKIYWCDFFNRRRTFNTADPDAFFINPSQIDSTSDLNESIVVLQQINEGTGGILPSGMYQYTYRLLNTQGLTTQFANLGNLIHIVVDSENTATVTNYIKESYNFITTNKSTTIKINGVDTNYDRIQIAYVRRRTLSNLPEFVSIITDEPIDKTSGTFTYIHTGRETSIPITIEELVNPIRPVDINKTLAIKDSMLLIGNVKSSVLDLPNWDSKAFRYTHSGVTYSTPDDVNPNQAPDSYNNYLYQSNGTTLGGEGTNVRYEFVHNTPDSITDMDGNANPNPGPPYRSISFGTTTFNRGAQSYTNQNFFTDPLSPYLEAVMKGYQRDEIYRFGIVFFDKKGFPGFVKWIADIRIPSIYMPNTAQGDPLERTSQFPLMGNSGQNYYGLPIGIKFTVNTSSINDQISGFSIVRVKREQGDKTILAQGLIQPAFLTSPSGISYIALKNDQALNPTPLALSLLNKGFYDIQYASIYTPETFFETFGILNGNSAESVEIIDILNTVTLGQQAYGPAAGNNITNSTVGKYYMSNVPVLNNTYRQPIGVGAGGVGKKFQVAKTTNIGQIGINSSPITDDIGNQIMNISPGSAYLTQGGKTVAVRFAIGASGFNDWTNVGRAASSYMTTDNMFSGGTTRRYLVNYKRVVANQYGGNTETQKSNNDYILCNHYQPVTTTTSYVADVFGGDVWVNVFDHNDERKALWSIAANTVSIGTVQTKIEAGGVKTDCYLGPKLFVCESCINVNARAKDDKTTFGVVHPIVNTTYYQDGAGGTASGLDGEEDRSYNPMFSNENDIQTFIPKPIPFIEQNAWDNRIYASQVKINGELSDSWNVFAQGDYKDVDGTFGPINSMLVFDNQLYFLQDRSIGVLPVNPRAVLNGAGTTGSQLQIGIGNKLDKHQYISTNTGTKHQWSVLDSPNAVYWYDVLAKKQYSYNPGRVVPLSDVKGMHTFFDRQLTDNFLTNDNPILRKGVCNVYDYKNNELISTFHDFRTINDEPIYNEFTIAYNELADCFTSLYSFKPTIYITNRQIYLSPSTSVPNALYAHSKGSYSNFYGTIFPSTLKVIVNENPLMTKVFDNQTFETEAINNNNPLQPININNSTWNIIRMYNDYQNTDFQTLITDVTVKREERSVNIAIPRNRVLYTGTNSPNIFTNLSPINILFGTRIRDKYITCDYSYDNTQNLLFKVHNIATNYRISPR